MEEAPSTPTQLTSLFENEVLDRLARLRLNPVRRFTNRSRGEHLTGKGGSSTEFSDYRNYVPGDDIRYVDWNIFSRLHRPYMKQYQHEEEMHVVILLDASSSMMFDDKIDRAKQLAGAFGTMGLINMERVSLYVFNHTGDAPQVLPPATGRVKIRRLLEFLENIEGGGDYSIEASIESMLRVHRGRGVAVIISDFLTFGELHRPMNMLYSNGLEVFGVQVLSPTELDPDVTGDLRFVDSESGAVLDISSVGELLGIYTDHLNTLRSDLEQMCRQRSGRFLSVSSEDSLEWVLFDLFRRRGWVQ